MVYHLRKSLNFIPWNITMNNQAENLISNMDVLYVRCVDLGIRYTRLTHAALIAASIYYGNERLI